MAVNAAFGGDLGFLSAYCVGWDLYDLLMSGFTGATGKMESKPAKHLRSALGQVVNVGGTEEVTIKELALLVREMSGSESAIEYISYDKAYGPGFEDMQRRCPDISKIRDLISFQPKVNLRGIIQSVIDYYTE